MSDSFTPNVSSRITPRLHPKTNEVIPRVDEWFLHHWPFLNEAVYEEFKSSDPALFTCYAAPDALDERLELVCKLLNIGFVVDDALDNLSIEEAQGSSRKFVGLILGHEDVHPSTQVEKVIHDLYTEIRRIGELGQNYCEEVVQWLKFATRHDRSKWKSSSDFSKYCEYRFLDAGYGLTISMLRYALDIKHPQRDDEVVSECEHLVGYHCMLVNDLFSYRKEMASKSTGEIGEALMNSVLVVQNSRDIGEHEAMMWLERYCEKLEGQFEGVVSRTAHLGEDAKKYINALRLLIAGNLKWSTVCGRYNKL
ncbi:hypothetical protein M422DRAFT_39167 [Sphaerobolus stellatus SS14]|uniref:Terpene synthase n=1 Tax=Sphaerobolus stellatus (strain SS14) TaxID=990650 RepID=A0A0C9UH20_SPHS4|nr:hypothetical protein M422DRAFT_39167 [Sphaerobolus stellatus SS14]